MANMEDQNATVSLADSAVWDPGNHSNTSSALLSRPICLTMPLFEAPPPDFLACADGGNPYLTACYVRKDIMTCFKIWTIFLFSLHLLRHLEFWEKLQFLPFLWEVHNNPYGLSLSPDRESTLQPPPDDSLVAPTALTSNYSQFGGAIDSDQVRKLAFCFSSSSFLIKCALMIFLT